MTTNRTDRLICGRPFDWFEIHADGSVFCCCPAWIRHPIGNILTEPVESIWNSPKAVEIRKTMLNGSQHLCSARRCPFLKNKAQPICTTDSEAGKAILKLARQLPLDHWPLPKELNLCFDHSCNLACPSCRKSIQVSQDEERRQAEIISALIIDQLVPTAEEITLSGYGDPFASPVYWGLLCHLNSLAAPPRLRLHTNGQLFTKERWAELPNLHSRVRSVEISVDAATPQTYQINRAGGSFARLLDNLTFLKELGYPLTLSMVVQQNNYREIPHFIELAADFNANVYLSQLVNWGTFSHKEFLQRAVHLTGHPEHGNFVNLLSEIPASPSYNPGNLLPLIG